MQREPENASSSVSCCALSYGLKCVCLSATQRTSAVGMLVALNAALNSALELGSLESLGSLGSLGSVQTGTDDMFLESPV